MHETKENKNVYLFQYFHYVLNLILKNHKKTQKKNNLKLAQTGKLFGLWVSQKSLLSIKLKHYS